MLVSFIIIAHNEEKNLKNLLEDLNGQTYPKKLIEVILIDSISSDNTKNVMNEFRNSNKEFNKIIIKSNVKKYYLVDGILQYQNLKGISF
ncbi:TPA: glycosyltransferase [Clostridium perfringens]|nr:glycosyltransferase [Clostridium perfringens]MDU1597216.1 glycosyltransferase [Clostridium perfringens]